MPKVTIGLPVYNGARYLAETFESLLGQTFTDLEIVVCDNASTDGTREIARRFANQDPRVRYVRNPQNIGANRNYNLSMSLANGEYFKLGADDDVLAPTYIEKMVAILDQDPAVAIAHSAIRYIDDDGQPLVYDPTAHRLTDKSGRIVIEVPDENYAMADDPIERFRNVLRHTTTCHFVLGLLRMSVVRKTEKFGLYYSADRAFLAEMALHGKFVQHPDVLFDKREHSKNSRSLSPAEKAKFAGQKGASKRAERMHLLRVIWNAPISPWHKTRCLAVGAGSLARRVMPAFGFAATTR